MTNPNFILSYIFLIAILFSCSKSDPKPSSGEEGKKGKQMFYVKGNLVCGNITVTIGSISKKIISSAGSNPPCSHSGSALFELDEGTYSFIAKCDSGTDNFWEGEVKIYKGECQTTLLEEKSELPKEGQAFVWINKDIGCGTIKVTINDVSQNINRFISTGEPDCLNFSDGAVFKLLHGSYNYTAECSKYKWSGSFEVVAGKCQKILLENPVNTIPVYAFSEPSLLTKVPDAVYATSIYRVSATNKLFTLTSNKLSIQNSIGSTPTFRVFTYSKPTFVGSSSRVTSLAINKEETKVYSVAYLSDYRGDIYPNEVWLYSLDLKTSVATPIANHNTIGKIKYININSSGELIATSDLNNGSLIRIEDDGSIITIASNLIAPANFAEHDGSYFVSINDVVKGSIVVIDPLGQTRSLITNLLKPNDLVFDNFGNLVVKYERTIGGENQFIYSLYTPNGEFISNLIDPSNYLIVSSMYGTQLPFIMPMYIDENNNLVFDHTGGYPVPLRQRGLWRINLNKK